MPRRHRPAKGETAGRAYRTLPDDFAWCIGGVKRWFAVADEYNVPARTVTGRTRTARKRGLPEASARASLADRHGRIALRPGQHVSRRRCSRWVSVDEPEQAPDDLSRAGPCRATSMKGIPNS